MEFKMVRPLMGKKIRDPETKKHLSESGSLVPWTSYWRRRHKDQEIEIVQAKNEISTQPKKTNKKESE